MYINLVDYRHTSCGWDGCLDAFVKIKMIEHIEAKREWQYFGTVDRASQSLWWYLNGSNWDIDSPQVEVLPKAVSTPSPLSTTERIDADVLAE
jgi:hypothetical protein